jgi:glycosyltransferase 2 family protein
MKHLSDIIWGIVGLVALCVAVWLLYRELHGLSLADVEASLAAIGPTRFVFVAGSTLIAYVALAFYDYIALAHMGRRLRWRFVALVSFVTYALAHNIGATVFSGGLIRYRAYSTKGLSAAQVAGLVAFCSLTYTLSMCTVGGFALTFRPDLATRLGPFEPWMGQAAGAGLLALFALYVVGSLRHFPPMKLGKFSLLYPRPGIAARQLLAGPIEILGAAGIIYFALPAASNPGFIVIVGIFVAAFSVALLSHAPGGVGVLEFSFLKALSDVPRADVVAALLVFRLFYLLAPFIFAIIVAGIFERRALFAMFRRRAGAVL